MAVSGPLCTEHVSDLSETNSGMEDPTRAGESGQGRRRSRDAPGSSGPSLLLQPWLWGLGAASLVFLEGRDPSWLGWLNLRSAPNRG
ncbi:uncharacterized protein LOC115504182 [Lynx canadensis]|uniref:uncharacterized protein LOC115504182 n=1 Tax=Lynx canadensis TaxID=61383 RepID=UPI0011B080CF|nr:uncharacterized protein LOC115504182 [Lynx canadensis]